MFFILKFLCLVAVYILLLPLNFLVSVVIRLAWKPAFAFDVSVFHKSVTSLDTKLRQACTAVDVNRLLVDGDGPKFLGMLVYSSPRSEMLWSNLKKFWGTDTFLRYDPELIPDQKDAATFSGDMLSGMCLGISMRASVCGLTQEELFRLKTICDNIIFSGMPLKIPHSSGKFTFDRGWVWRPWEPGSNSAYNAAAFLYMCYSIFGDTKYKTLANLLRLLAFPVSFCHDVGVFVGKVYGKAWYPEHSTMLMCVVAAIAGKAKEYKAKAKFLSTRYFYNPDINALYTYYFAWWSSYETSKASQLVFLWLSDYSVTHKATGGEDASVLPTTDYFSLRDFKRKRMPNIVLPCRYRTGSSYLHEQNPLVPQVYASPSTTVDYIFLHTVYNASRVPPEYFTTT